MTQFGEKLVPSLKVQIKSFNQIAVKMLKFLLTNFAINRWK